MAERFFQSYKNSSEIRAPKRVTLWNIFYTAVLLKSNILLNAFFVV